MDKIAFLNTDFQSIEAFLLTALVTSFLIILMTNFFKKVKSSKNRRFFFKKALQVIFLFLILAILIYFILNQGQNTATTVGLIGAGLSFALQEVILSFAGWVMIIISKPFRIGDRIEINKIKGDVIDIGFIRTTVMEVGEWVTSDNYTGRIVQISNATIFKNDSKNYSKHFPFVWDEMKVPIKYGSDLDQAKQLITDATKQVVKTFTQKTIPHWEEMNRFYMIEDARVEPLIVYRLTDNWVEFTIRYVTDYKTRLSTSHNISDNIYQAVKKTKKVDLASTTLAIIETPPIDLKQN